jgi:hypothetical protein
MGARVALDQSDRRRTIDVVVAKNGNRLSIPDSGSKSFRRFVHVL